MNPYLPNEEIDKLREARYARNRLIRNRLDHTFDISMWVTILVSLLPVSVVFLCLQKYFIEGIATSGLKG